VQEAAAALLEQAQDHAKPDGSEWMDIPYTIERPKKSVLHRLDERPEYVESTTTPIQEVYRAIRRKIEAMRSVKADPANAYLYIDGAEIDEALDGFCFRLGKYSDIGGYTATGHDIHALPGSPSGLTHSTELYTADVQTADEIETLLAELPLTQKQNKIARMRLQGYSVEDVARYFGIRPQSVRSAMQSMQDKMVALGKTPRGWTEETRKDAKDEAKPIVQMDKEGNVINTFSSAVTASAETGINAGSIRGVCLGKRKTAGGYIWKYQ